MLCEVETGFELLPRQSIVSAC